MFEIIAVTNRIQCREPFAERLARLRNAGVSAVVLREKDLPDAEYLELARKAAGILEGSAARLIIHGHADIAKALNIKSVQLPLDGLAEASRETLGYFSGIGASCHSLEDALRAERLGATYIVLGNIFETSCKPGLPGKGTGLLKEVCTAVSVPVYAIGGVKKENLAAVRAAGAAGACIMGDFMTASRPELLCFDKRRLALYGITDRRYFETVPMAGAVEKAIRGGMTMLQLREKSLPEDELLREAVEIKKICGKYNVPLIINDDPEVALRCGADGVHVGAEDMSVAEIRKAAPQDFIIGATCKTVSQAKKAEAEGADYIGVGAVFPSPTKTDAIRVTPEQLFEIASAVDIPAVAVGGIDADNIDGLKGTGISGVAVISALFGAPDVEAAAALLREKSAEITCAGRGIKAAIFDMDGTLLDSLHVWDRILLDFFESMDRPPDEELKKSIGSLSLREGAALLKDFYRLDMTVDEIVSDVNGRLAWYYENEVDARPGVREYLAGMRSAGIKACVATESSMELAEAALRRLGLLENFEFVLSCQNRGIGKNTPDVYLEAAERLGAEPGECLVFEDALYALRTAKSAGFHTVAVYEPHEKRQNEMRKAAEKYIGDWESAAPGRY